MKTHGGRSFLHGHLFGDNVHEFLAPCIYEGEGDMLGMSFFKSLVKEHGKRYFESIGVVLQEAKIRNFNPMNPLHGWKLRKALTPYAKWWMSESVGVKSRPTLPPLPAPLGAHAEFALDNLRRSPLEISGTMRKHQLKLADRQCRMAELSLRVQTMVTILVTSLYAGRQSDELVRSAADILCRDLTRALVCERPSDSYFRAATQLGRQIAEHGFDDISRIQPADILMPYANETATT